MSLISAGACGGIDLLGNWWEVRRLHAVSDQWISPFITLTIYNHKIPTAAVSALALLTTGYLSINLYKASIASCPFQPIDYINIYLDLYNPVVQPGRRVSSNSPDLPSRCRKINIHNP